MGQNSKGTPRLSVRSEAHQQGCPVVDALEGWGQRISSMRKVTPEKLSWRAMYMPLTFMSMATISMAPHTPVGKHRLPGNS